jgi:hypothetical protein
MVQMIIGDPHTFAIESLITEAYARTSLRALGCFVIHVGGNRYGVYEPKASMLANSFDEVEKRIARRGKHSASFADELEGGKIADAFRDGIYGDNPKDNYLGLPLGQFQDAIYSAHLLWTPDGDEAFDDGSYILQFDIGDRARLIAFKCGNSGLSDPLSLRDAWITADRYYQTLGDWRDAFESEWAALPKKQI